MYELVCVPGEDKCVLALVEKPEDRGTPRGPAHSWADNLKWTLKKGRIGGYGLDSSGSGW